MHLLSATVPVPLVWMSNCLIVEQQTATPPNAWERAPSPLHHLSEVKEEGYKNDAALPCSALEACYPVVTLHCVLAGAEAALG